MANLAALESLTYYEKVTELADIWRALFLTPFTPGELKATIKSYPIDASPEALAVGVWCFCYENPTLIEPFLVKIRIVLKNKKMKHFRVFNELGGAVKFGEIFYPNFFDIVSHNAHTHHGPPEGASVFQRSLYDEKKSQIHPILVSALVIGAARKADLITIGDYYSMSMDGLHLPGSDVRSTPDVQEIAAIAALIFFDLHGSYQFASILFSPNAGETQETVLEGLEGLKRRSIIQYEPAVRLLERVILEVDTHVGRARSVADVYHDLFV